MRQRDAYSREEGTGSQLDVLPHCYGWGVTPVTDAIQLAERVFRRRFRTNVGAGLPAIQAPRSFSETAVMLSQASQLVSSRPLKLGRVRAVDGRLKASGA